MNNDQPSSARVQELLSQLLDGEISACDLEALNALLRKDPSHVNTVVDHLLLDSLLAEQLGTEPLTALVDLVEPNAREASSPAQRRQHTRVASKLVWRWAGGFVAAAAMVVLVLLLLHSENRVQARATTVLRAARQEHIKPVERIYLVAVEWDQGWSEGFASPQNVRIFTQGDRFWVEMNRGAKSWKWGRNPEGAIWVTLGARRALIIEREEIGAPLQRIATFYSLELQSLLDNVLQTFQVDYISDSGATHVISAKSRRGWIREITIEVDKETKAIRQLVVRRWSAQRGGSTAIFTLVDARAPNDSLYRLQGHLQEPFRLLSRHSQPQRRRTVLKNWFGPAAESWIVKKKH